MEESQLLGFVFCFLCVFFPLFDVLYMKAFTIKVRFAHTQELALAAVPWDPFRPHGRAQGGGLWLVSHMGSLIFQC